MNSNLMRRLAAALLGMLMLLAAVTARGSEFTYFDKEQQINFAKSCLTEVYGYLSEETESFVYEQTIQDGIATLHYWQKDHPEWVYSCTFSLTDGQRLATETPFHTDYHGYPGENGLRYFIRGVEAEQLLGNWNKAAREAFRALLEQEGIKPCAALDKGLLDATYTPQQAMKDFFISCFDSPEYWPQAVKEWYEEILREHGLETPDKAAPEAGVTRYRSEGATPYVLTEFVLSTPPELVQVFAHPALKDWTVYSGTFVMFDEGEKLLRREGDLGLVIFAKGDERLLCSLSREAEEAQWHIEPVSDRVIPANSEPIITRSEPLSTGLSSRYQIAYDTEECRNVTMEVDLERQQKGAWLCKLRQYRFTDAETGHVYQLTTGYGDIQLYCTDPATGICEKQELYCYFPDSLAYLAAGQITDLCRDPAKAEDYALPEGTILTGGVHLRKETSSRSKDLGMLHAGTIAKKLGMEPGDPNVWYHVEVGGLKGYVSGAYVDETPGPYAQACLPIAMAVSDQTLKEHTGLFAKETATVGKGSTMHVIIQEDGWLYVAVPQTQPAGMRMDTNGMFGWIRTEDVLLGSTALSLEWKAMEASE